MISISIGNSTSVTLDTETARISARENGPELEKPKGISEHTASISS